MNSIDEKYFPWEGHNKIIDTQEKAISDSGIPLNLYKGTYTTISFSFDVLIRKGSHIKFESYDLLRNFQHDNALPLLDFYTEAGSQGRLVIPKVDSSFKIWFQAEGKSLLFDSMGHMASSFINMIINFCDLIESLHKDNLILKEFAMDDLYINVSDGIPNLLVLLVAVEKVKYLGISTSRHNWDYVRNFVNWCEDQCKIQSNDLTKRFCKFIGTNCCTLEKLKNYPLNWDDKMKGEYLMSLFSADHSTMRHLLQGADIDWPYRKQKRILDNLPKLMCQIIEWEETKNGRKYNILDFFNYIILVRNIYKHFRKLPVEIKDVLRTQRDIIGIIEKWTPDLWIKVYERIGWP